MSKIAVNCNNCNKELLKFPSKIKRDHNHFCDKECRKQWHLKPEVIRKRFLKHVNIVSDKVWAWEGYKDSHGYGTFRVNGKTVRAHRYSYELFAGKIPSDMCVLHGADDNKLNIAPKNLWLGTHQDNMKDCVNKGRNADQYGEKNPCAKLTENDVIKIRKLYLTGMYSQREIGELFLISRSNISYIINRKSWQ